MRAAVLFAIGAVLGVNTLELHAEAICNTKQLRNTGDLPGAQSTEVSQEIINKTIEDACATEPSFEEINDFITHRSGSIVLTITRTNSPKTLNIKSCKDQFHDIIKRCITEQDVMGGTVLTGRLMYEVFNDDSQDGDIMLLKDSKVNVLTKRLPDDGDVESAGIEARREKKSESTKAETLKEKQPSVKKPIAKKPKSKKAKAEAFPKSSPLTANGKDKGKSNTKSGMKVAGDELIRKVECRGSDIRVFQRGGQRISK